ncbi:MAG: surface antigen [Gemmatimonadetes bacterium]|nr:surface antigen [Gemmatimonadota bacterium]
MTRLPLRWACALAPLLALVVSVPAGAQGYFGRNKVQYETFPWKILKSEHFDNFFYPAESLIVSDAGRMAERWYARHSDTFRHAFDRKSLVFYADHPDFEQTNVISEQLEEGTGGVTESNRTRVIMPFTGIYADNDHVLGHELVHVFQYNIAEGTPGGGLMRLDALPLFLIEGMAEYFSLGREDPLTAMWMRDAVMRNKFPTIKQLNTDPRFFPYRYGQALWAYVGGRWGDRAIVDVYRTALRLGWDNALVRVLGENSDSLSKDWAAANRQMYLPQIAGRTHPDSTGARLIPLQRSGDYNLAPTLSPDGKLFAFFSSRSLFSIDLFVGDAVTGKIIKKLGGPSSDPHFDAISFINSAGDWSPNSDKFAFIVYAEGNNEIAILDTKSTNVERRIKLPGIGAVSHVSWSPDGRTLAFSGQAGGVSDLYLLDLQAGTIRQLTNDRYADIQPTWSPDGKTLAFSTDRGPQTDFNKLVFSPLQLATYDIASGRISVFSPFAHGKHINPQFSPDGRDLFFVSDQDGIADIYRLNLATAQVFRITSVATGVSGITTVSPAISVARKTGRMLFTTFYDQGNEIRGFDAAQTVGTPVTPALVAEGAQLPPPTVTRSLVNGYLADATTGLPPAADFAVVPYKPAFSLDAISQPQIGASVGGPLGPGAVGGVAMIFGDQLSDRQIYASIQANGTVKDIGGAVQYYNFKNRWNYGYGLEHVPYLTGGVFLRDTTVNSGGGNVAALSVNQVIQRIYFDNASINTQYPFSSTRRLELSANITHLGFDTQIIRDLYIGNSLVDENVSSQQSAYKPVWYAGPSIALVGDNSFAAFTSPVEGERYRLQYSPTVGSVSYQLATADYRKYLFFRPFTLAFRGMSIGRYGKGAEDVNSSYPIYLGEESLIRGYGYGSFGSDECVSNGTTAADQSRCPAFERLFGSKVAVINTEFRIPLFGTEGFGLLNFPYLPTEVSPFFDAGVSYTNSQNPDFRLTRSANDIPAKCAAISSDPVLQQQQAYYPCADRIPVFSAGVSMRFNLMGYAILEAYAAHPFQRPKKNWVWGFQLAPGW